MKFKVWIILFVFCITNFLYAQKTGEWSECGASRHECGIQYRTRLNKMEVRGCMKGKYWRTIPGTNTWFMFNKSRWRSRTTDAFYKAQASCVEYGAQLASITSKEEYKFIKTAWDTRTDVGRKACWQIGLVRTGGDASQNGWHWLDGHSKTWPIRWAPRQPNDGKWNAAINHESEACIKKKNNIADINDFNTNFGKNYLKPYICKKKCSIDKCWCGQANSLSQRMVNGEEANKNEFPWQVGLVFAEDNKWSNILCGGSIISSKTILSAAHCTKRFGGGSNLDKLWVVVGEHHTSYNDGEQYYKVCKSFEHPEYIGQPEFDYDYGILTLCEDLTWSKDVSPVCLPNKDSNYEGDGAIASGWGLLVHEGNQPVKLQKIKLFVLTKEECCRTGWNIDYMTPRMVCGGNEDKFICNGDSGGPLVVLDNSKNAYVLVGVSSYGSKCGKDNKAPSVFAKVSTVLDWIINNMRGSQCS